MENVGGGLTPSNYDKIEFNSINNLKTKNSVDLSGIHIKYVDKFLTDKLNKMHPIALFSAWGAFSLSSVVVLASLIGIPAKNIQTKLYNEDVAVVDYYETQKYLRADLPDAKDSKFYDDMEKYDNEVSKLSSYIECSKKLHALGLNKYDDITCFDDSVVFVGPERVDELIEEYCQKSTEIRKSGNNLIGDDVVILNHLAYELKELEKMYNKKIFDGYTALEEYGLSSAKSYLADLYGGEASKYEIQFHDYQHDGGIEINGPGLKYGDSIDSDLYNYLYAIRNVYKAENAIVNPNPEEYNRERNNLILDTIEKYNTEGADVIEEIDKENNKKR